MKVGILTQPLYNNYGCLLQAFALYSVLAEMGNDVWIIQRERPLYNEQSLMNRIALNLKRRVKSYLGEPVQYIKTREEMNAISRNTNIFKDRFIPQRTPLLLSSKALARYVKKNSFDAFVVGSDQVWRPGYSANIYNYYLDFCKDDRIKRVAYAASFGVDIWEYSQKETIKCKELARRFDLVSVREISAVQLCHKQFDVSAIHVLDPTLLLDKSVYCHLVELEHEPHSSGSLFYYLLDMNEVKSRTVNDVSSLLGLSAFTVYPEMPQSEYNIKNRIDKCVFPRVTQWLRAFMDSKMVITDSFHGCVFSIIFNIPFWVIRNSKRGNARFDSLLSLFDLKGRMIDEENVASVDYSSAIDWVSVNSKRKELVAKSLEVLDILR